MEPLKGEFLQSFINVDFIFYSLAVFMMVEGILSMEIFMQEKARKTIETLLTTPISLRAILFGKVLAIYLPATLAAFFAVIVQLISHNWTIMGSPFAFIPKPVLWIHLLIVVPLLGFFLASLVGVWQLRSPDFKSGNVIHMLTSVAIILVPSLFIRELPPPETFIISFAFLTGILGFASMYLSKRMKIEKIVLSS